MGLTCYLGLNHNNGLKKHVWFFRLTAHWVVKEKKPAATNSREVINHLNVALAKPLSEGLPKAWGPTFILGPLSTSKILTSWWDFSKEPPRSSMTGAFALWKEAERAELIYLVQKRQLQGNLRTIKKTESGPFLRCSGKMRNSVHKLKRWDILTIQGKHYK